MACAEVEQRVLQGMSLRRRAAVVATGGAPAPRRLDTVLRAGLAKRQTTGVGVSPERLEYLMNRLRVANTNLNNLAALERVIIKDLEKLQCATSGDPTSFESFCKVWDDEKLFKSLTAYAKSSMVDSKDKKNVFKRLADIIRAIYPQLPEYPREQWEDILVRSDYDLSYLANLVNDWEWGCNHFEPDTDSEPLEAPPVAPPVARQNASRRPPSSSP